LLQEFARTVTVADGTMRVAVMTAPHATEDREVAIPEPGPGQALVRIRAAAICTWEQRTFSGAQRNTFPFVGGHEIAGEVAELGPGEMGELAVGDRVALGPTACGRCHWCLTGRDRACRSHYDAAIRYGDAWGPGGFAEYKVHPAGSLFRVADAPLDEAALAEPLACAVHAARLLGMALAEDVVILGAGAMGLVNLVVAKKRGARVIVSELDPSRLARARELGADETIDASTDDPVAAVHDLTEGRGADVVIAAIGGAEVNAQANKMLAERGRFGIFASAHPEPELTLRPNALHDAEQAIVGVVSKDRADFYAAARLIRYRQVDLSGLVEAVHPLTELQAALEAALRPGSYRVVVAP